MKICSYCGRENSDEAINCRECGTSLPSQPAATKAPRAPRHLGIRILIACTVWTIISGISLYVSWKNAEHSAAWIFQSTTQRQLTAIGKAITAYQGKFNTCPTNLQDLKAVTNEAPAIGRWYVNEEILNVDGWGRPLVLVTEETNCFAMTYGRDGKPGGTGIDYDITSINPHPSEAVPTFAQFYFDKTTSGMITSSYFCGFLAALLSFLTVRIPDLTRRGLMILAVSLFATLLGAFLVTTVITAVHIPSGH